MNIAIDGPAGAGKGTIAREVAKRLNLVYVDTGAMYRAMGYYFSCKNIDGHDMDTVCRECGNVDISIKYIDGEQVVFCNGEDVNDKIRTPRAGEMASLISVYEPVRERLVKLQQNLARETGVVMDGRDIGTVVLPKAELKIYLNASCHERAKRRYLELRAKGEDVNLEQVERDIIQRDERDMNREISPLKKAEDAVEVDSTDMTIGQVTDYIIGLVK